MEVKDIIALCVGGVILVGVIVYMIINKKSTIMEWLLDAVTEAEKELGEKTGQIKLHKVWSWFCDQFPVVAAILPFPVFSSWVDVALETMREWIEQYENVAKYIKG